ncbi:MAG: YlxR family protein [Clostridia bacterium]|nr:YlxR family protein [Clostridia bacterium]
MDKKEKHVPLRMCAACRGMKPKAELLRITLKNGTPALDLSFKAQGRGMYICRTEECVLKAKKKSAVERALGCAVDKEFYDSLLNNG